MALGADHHRITADLQKMWIIRTMRRMAADTGNFGPRPRQGKTHRVFSNRMIQRLLFMAAGAKLINVFLEEMRSLAAGVGGMTCDALGCHRMLDL